MPPKEISLDLLEDECQRIGLPPDCVMDSTFRNTLAWLLIWTPLAEQFSVFWKDLSDDQICELADPKQDDCQTIKCLMIAQLLIAKLAPMNATKAAEWDDLLPHLSSVIALSFLHEYFRRVESNEKQKAKLIRFFVAREEKLSRDDVNQLADAIQRRRFNPDAFGDSDENRSLALTALIETLSINKTPQADSKEGLQSILAGFFEGIANKVDNTVRGVVKTNIEHSQRRVYSAPRIEEGDRPSIEDTLQDDRPNPERAFSSRELFELLQSRATQAQQRILELFKSGTTFRKEIAKSLGITRSTVDVQLNRLKKNLKFF